MSVTPNMNLTLPDPTVTEGPDWAEMLNTVLETIDNHDHTSGNGKLVPIAGIDVNQNLDMEQLEIVDAKAVNFQNLSTALSGASNVNKFHVVNGNVWFTNDGGTPVQITDGNSIVSSIVVPSSPLMPSGTVLDFAGSSAPVGFLLCDGSAVSRTTYSDLFAAIGTAWGVGDGSTTFNLPNFNGRVAVGSGNYTDTVSGSITRTLAQKIGAEAHLLTEAQMPSHTHVQDAHTHTLPVRNAGGASNPNFNNNAGATNPPIIATDVSGSTTATNQNTGGGLSHNNMQPSLVVLKMIKT